MKTSDDIPAGPFSEQELREQWNRQADEFNQWDSLDSDEKLAWAQTQALSSGGWIVPSIVNAQPSLANDDPIRAALERLVARLNETTDFGGPVPAWSDSFYAALEALAKAEPAPTGKDSLQVALPAEGEVAKLVKELKEHAHHINEEDRLGSLVDNDLPPLLTRAADLLEQRHPTPVPVLPEDAQVIEPATRTILVPVPAPVPTSERLPVDVEQALIKAECALSDIAEGEPEENEGDADALLQWAEQRAATALSRIRPVMRLHGILTSEWPPLPATDPPLPGKGPKLPDGYIDPGHSDADREMLEAFYLAARSEGGTTDEITLRGIRAAIAFSRALVQPVAIPGAADDITDKTGRRWDRTMDAALWASAFCAIFPGTDEGLMIGWFANAIMAGWDHHRWKIEAETCPVPVAERLPGPENCAPWSKHPEASPWCWMGGQVNGGWEWEQRSADYLKLFPDAFSHWLPFYALPLPTEEVTE